MECPKCGFTNEVTVRFCGGCGAPVPKPCPSCGFANPDGFKFCGGCGRPLAEEGVEKPARPEAERRQLAVLFCDLVDSTVLSSRLDPEDLREVVFAYQEASVRVVEQFRGHVAQYLGDGILIYFGYPQAHEDDARRAVLAGLGIVASMEEVNRRLRREYDLEIQVRIGIHHGSVVTGEVGSGARRERLALGQTPNIAARLQGLAQPDCVVLSSVTRHLAGPYFELEDLGRHHLKGVDKPVQVFRAVREKSTTLGSFEYARARGLAPMVGRSQEIAAMLRCLDQAGAGQGLTLLLRGEAGIGKSRIVQQFGEQAATREFRWLICACSSYHSNSAFFPIFQLLGKLFEIRADDATGMRLQKVEKVLESLGLFSEENVPLVASFLSIPLDERYQSFELPPEVRKEKTLDLFVDMILAMAERQPLAFTVEDLHWVDPSTLELLGRMARMAETSPVLLLLIARPSFELPWTTPEATLLPLGHLSTEQTEAMIRGVAGGKSLPAEVRELILSKTDGVPLFIEELTKMVIENPLVREGADGYELIGSIASLEIPTTLSGLLTARLDRLGDVKPIAQTAAVLGREFTLDMLAAVTALRRPAVRKALDDLEEAGLIYHRQEGGYTFRHALIRDAAYHSLLKRTRQEIHLEIARTLERDFPEVRASQPEMIARHFTEAGQAEEAIAFWLEAGKLAAGKYSNQEALAHLDHGLEVLATLPPSAERNGRELLLHSAKVAPLMALKGWASPEIGAAYSKAHELCRKVERSPRLFPVMRGVWSYHLAGGKLHKALELARELMAAAEHDGSENFLLAAHAALGDAYFWLGDVAGANAEMEKGLAIYDAEVHHKVQTEEFGEDSGAICLCYAALTEWLLGRPDRAEARNRESLALLDVYQQPFSQGFLLFNVTWHYVQVGDTVRARRYAEEMIALDEEHGLAVWGAGGRFMRGWAVAEEDPQRGIAEMETARKDWHATGVGVKFCIYPALLAERCRASGRLDDAESWVEIGLASLEERPDRYWLPELHRVRAEVLADQGAPEADVTRSLELALDEAARQEARSLELRALMALLRFRRRLGDGAGSVDAGRRLEEVYEGFTEGWQTPDLKQARDLLKT